MFSHLAAGARKYDRTRDSQLLGLYLEHATYNSGALSQFIFHKHRKQLLLLESGELVGFYTRSSFVLRAQMVHKVHMNTLGRRSLQKFDPRIITCLEKI